MTRRRCWHDSMPLTGDALPVDWKDGRRHVATFSGDGLVARKDEDETLRILRAGPVHGDDESRTVAIFPPHDKCVYEAAVDHAGLLGVYETNPGAPGVVRSHDASRGATNYHRVRALAARNAKFWETHEWTP